MASVTYKCSPTLQASVFPCRHLPAPIVFPRCGFCPTGPLAQPHPRCPSHPKIIRDRCSHKIWARPVRPLLSDGACSVLLLSVSETTNVIWEMTVVCWHQRLAAGIAVNRDINRVPGVMGEDTSSFLSLRAPAVSATNISTGPRNLRVHTIDWRRPLLSDRVCQHRRFWNNTRIFSCIILRQQECPTGKLTTRAEHLFVPIEFISIV